YRLISDILHLFVYGLYRRHLTASYGEAQMLETFAILLIILWILGLVSSYTLGGFIHILLVIAIIVVILRIIQGRSAV
ncbi:lmo0937 family membrane protein, partial [Methylobacter sp.]|uniref:lmo0937 family membrane protein n=1 Tax=Methylobacter sp. TaxID=2051955 RepID=UPI0025E6CFD2